MKKVISLLSAAGVLGLGFIASRSIDVDSALGVKDETEKTYLVQAAGDPLKETETATKNRKEVLNEVKYLLDKDSYEITYVYDTVFNGFAIKTTAENMEKVSHISGVTMVQESHTYARPEADNSSTGTARTVTDADIKAMKLGNYSAETMNATNADIKAITNADSFGGKNVTIGIADTGLFLNQVEGTTERSEAEDSTTYGSHLNAAAFKDLASGEYSYTDAMVQAAGLGHQYSHINNKIFYAYDYADTDSNVNPAKDGVSDAAVADNLHGTHVASLAAANGDDFKGIAPNAQLAIFKVFGDNSSGASTTAVIAALNDAAKLKIDIINLSLGQDLYDNSDSADDATYLATKACQDAGVIVNFAAGNSGKSTYSSSDGYSDWTTDTVEPGIVGGDALWDETTNIVASSNPDRAYYDSIMLVQNSSASNASAVSFKDQIVSSKTQTFTTNRYLTDLLTTYPEKNGQFQYVYVPGYGSQADYDAIGGSATVSGKIAVVNRGNLTFVNKTKLAALNGAIALIVVNNDSSSTFNFSMDFSNYSPTIPVCFVFQSTISTWGAYVQTPAKTAEGYGSIDVAGGHGAVTIAKNQVEDANDGNIISSFSNDGPAYNLDFGPTISAPGYNIIGAVNAISSNEPTGTNSTAISNIYGYEFLSGTSMATPNLTGAMALILGEKNPANSGALASASTTDYANEKKVLSMKAMSTADQLDDAPRITEASPRMEGAGRINAASILKADSYVTTTNSDLGGFSNSDEAKAELKNKGDLYVANADFTNTGEDYIEFTYTVHNDSATFKTYNASMSVMIPSLRVQVTHESYAAEEATSRSQTVGYDSSVTFNENDLSTYPTFVGYPTMSVNDDILTKDASGNAGYASMASGGDSSITVAAHSTASGVARIRIDNLKVNKDWRDSKVTNVSDMDLKDYIAKYFKDAGGTYVEGFLKLTPTDSTDTDYVLTLPYMGFYGDYTLGKAVEDFDFEKDSSHIYNSDLISNYLHNLNSQYAKPNAYAGSTISASGATLSATQLTSVLTNTTSLRANGTTLLSVNGSDDDKTHLYAGAKGVSDVLHASFFVNRSLSSASWTLTNKSGATTANGTLGDLFLYSDTAAVNNASAGVAKSWLVASGENIIFHRAYGEINLSTVAEGDYTLTFSFNVRGTNKTQTKSYTLTVDKTAPEVTNVTKKTTSTGRTNLTVTSTDASMIAIGSINHTTTKVSDNVYTASGNLTTSEVNADKVLITATDYAHNTSYALVHPSNLNSFVMGTFLTANNDFILTEEDPSSHSYSIAVTDKKGNDITLKSDYYVAVRIEAGLNVSDIIVKRTNVETTDFTYDSQTGMLIIHMTKDDFDFELSHAILSDNGGNTSSSTSDSTSSATSDSSSTNNNSSSSTSDEPKKGGCFGSVVAASSIAGALALFGVALGFKKKREEK